MRTKNNVSPERFVTAWQKAETAADAAKELGMKIGNARVRAMNYRKAGIPLKKMPRVGHKMNVAELSKLARGLAK